MKGDLKRQVPTATSEVPNPHRLIRASAGSGKTYALTLRYLQQLLSGAPPSTILATTFTRKAAGEILQRVLVRLAEAASDPQASARLGRELSGDPLPTTRSRRLLAELTRDLHRVEIGTLDSFFFRLVRTFRLELGVTPRASAAAPDELRVMRLRARALEGALDELAGKDWRTLEELVLRLHHRQARRSVARDLQGLLQGMHEVFRAAPLAELWHRLERPSGLTAEALDGALERLGSLGIGLGARLRQGLRRSLAAAEGGDWEAFLSVGLGARLAKDPPDRIYERQPIPSRFEPAMQPLIAHARAQLLGRVADQTAATFELLNRFEAHFERLRAQEGILLFSDLPWSLSGGLAALSEERLLEIHYRLDASVHHLLLDEFQDTAVEQWEVLRPFAEEIRAHGDGSRSFFCVGDTKQAVYGWRGGCAELFGRLERELALEASSEDVLDTSYRSSPVILQTVDRVFSRLAEGPVMESHRDTAVAWLEGYRPHRAANPERLGFVELRTSRLEAGGPGSDPGEHLRAAAELVSELGASAPGRSLGVLLSTNQGVRQILELLRQRGVDASGEGGSPIVDDPAVALLLSAVILADHPGDSVAAYHLFHSPLAGPLRLPGYAAGAAAQASAAMRRRLCDFGYAAVLAGWARELAAHVDRRGARRLTQLVELGERFDALGPALRPREFARFVEASAVEEPSPAQVRVMTIHKAKGLEFDLVVLCDLDRTLGRIRDAVLYVERGAPVAPVRAVYRSAPRVVRSQSPELRRAHGEELRRRLLDDLGAFYVALTRPRHALHLLVRPRGRKKDGSPRAETLTYGALLRQALCPEAGVEAVREGESLFVAGDPDWARLEQVPPPPLAPSPVAAEQAPPGKEVPRPPRLRLVRPSRLGEVSGRVRGDDLLREASATPRLRGRLYHAWLRRVEWLDPDSPLPLRDELHELARAMLPRVEAGWIDDQIAALTRMVGRPAVLSVLTAPQELGRDETAELWRERPFAQVYGGRLVHGVLDRVVVFRRHDRVIGAELLEFKTDEVEGRDVDAAVERYSAQIGVYRQALGAMLSILDTAIRARFLFLAPGELREV